MKRSTRTSRHLRIALLTLAAVAPLSLAACSGDPASSLGGPGGDDPAHVGAGGGQPGSSRDAGCGAACVGAEGGSTGPAGGESSGADAGAGGGSGGSGGGVGQAALPKHALIGYWHDFANPSGKAFPIRDVSRDWDVIVVAFAMNAQPSGSVAFQLDPTLDEAEFKADVAAKRAAGKKVVLSLGGQDGTVSLATASDVDNFVTSLTKIIETYGFDGLDIDLETGAGITAGAPVQQNLVTGIKRIKAATRGAAFYLSMAPEHPYVQGAIVANAGIWGSYLPIIEGLRDDLTVLHVQLYNDGDLPTPWGTYHPTTVDLLVGAVDMLVGGFQPATGQAFKGLRADQVAFGIPSGNAAANPGNFVPVATIEAAFTCVTTGAMCGTHTPSRTYPLLRGVMTWSINWDAHDGPASFSQPLAAFLHAQP
jgi:chitinase